MKRRKNRAQRMKTALTTPVFNVVPETDTSPAEIIMYGDICEARPYDGWTGEPVPGNYVALDEITAELDKVRDASEIVIRINSSGGDLQTGVSIHDQLRGFKGHKTAIVEGAAESAATLIMCAADTVKVHPASMFLIHNPLCFLFGYYNTLDLDVVRNQYAAAEKSMRAIYAEKTGMSDEELQAIIDGSTWYIGQEAIDAGFADEMVEKPGEGEDPDEDPDDPDRDEDPDEDAIETDAIDGLVFVNGVSHRLMNLGGSIPARVTGGDNRRVEDSAEERTMEGEDDVNKEDIKTADDLCSAFPEMTDALIDKVKTSERNRIKSIEAIEDRIGPELANKAKYEQPMTAEQAAYQAMMAEDKANAKFIEDLDADLDDSGAKDVSAEPVKVEVADDNTETFVDKIAGLYNKNLKGVK